MPQHGKRDSRFRRAVSDSSSVRMRLLHYFTLATIACSFSVIDYSTRYFKSPITNEMMKAQHSFVEEKKDDGDSLAAVLGKLSTPKMIVFDKDGTLGDCTASLRLWAESMTRNLAIELAKIKTTEQVQQDVETFHLAIGWDLATRNVVPSAPLAAGTWEEQIQTAGNLFANFGIESLKASEWHKNLGNLHGCDPPLLPDLRDMMLACKQANLKVAICTSDDRPSTDASISNWDLEDLIDYSICGNEVSCGKPSAMPLEILCQRAGVHVTNCIVVGDTTSDTGMARNAGAGLCIGVLTGSGTTDQLLRTGAHVILPDVGHIPSLLDAVTKVQSTSDITLDQPEFQPQARIPTVKA